MLDLGDRCSRPHSQSSQSSLLLSRHIIIQVPDATGFEVSIFPLHARNINTKLDKQLSLLAENNTPISTWFQYLLRPPSLISLDFIIIGTDFFCHFGLLVNMRQQSWLMPSPIFTSGAFFLITLHPAQLFILLPKKHPYFSCQNFLISPRFALLTIL